MQLCNVGHYLFEKIIFKLLKFRYSAQTHTHTHNIHSVLHTRIFTHSPTHPHTHMQTHRTFCPISKGQISSKPVISLVAIFFNTWFYRSELLVVEYAEIAWWIVPPCLVFCLQYNIHNLDEQRILIYELHVEQNGCVL